MSDQLDGVQSIKSNEFGQQQVQSETGGLSGIKARNVDKMILNASNDCAAFTELGTLFHSFGPCTANDRSYRVGLLEELDLASRGMTATEPSLDVILNSMWQQFGTIL